MNTRNSNNNCRNASKYLISYTQSACKKVSGEREADWVKVISSYASGASASANNAYYCVTLQEDKETSYLDVQQSFLATVYPSRRANPPPPPQKKKTPLADAISHLILQKRGDPHFGYCACVSVTNASSGVFSALMVTFS